jgi:hypothetical protein
MKPGDLVRVRPEAFSDGGKIGVIVKLREPLEWNILDVLVDGCIRTFGLNRLEHINETR